MNKELAEKITNIVRRHCLEINTEIGMLTDEEVRLSIMTHTNDIHKRKDGRPDDNMYYSFFGEKEGGGPRLINEYKFYSEEKYGQF